MPPQACLGNAIPVVSDVDLLSLDLPWSDGGQGLILSGATLTGTLEGDEFRLTSLRVDDEVVFGG